MGLETIFVRGQIESLSIGVVIRKRINHHRREMK